MVITNHRDVIIRPMANMVVVTLRDMAHQPVMVHQEDIDHHIINNHHIEVHIAGDIKMEAMVVEEVPTVVGDEEDTNITYTYCCRIHLVHFEKSLYKLNIS